MYRYDSFDSYAYHFYLVPFTHKRRDLLQVSCHVTHHSGLNAAQLWLQHQVLLLSNPAAVIAVLGCGRDQSVDYGLG